MSSETTYVRPITPEERQRQRIAALEAENAQRRRNEQAQQKAIASLSAQLQSESQRRSAESAQHSREMQNLRNTLSAESRRALDKMAQTHNQQLSALQSSLEENLKQREELYKQRSQEAEKRAEETRRQLEKQINATNLRIETISTNLKNQIDEVNTALNESISHLQGQINQNTADIKNILQREQHTADNAVEMLRLAQAMLQQVEESNELDRFVPEEAISVRAKMQNLVSQAPNLANPAIQASALERMNDIETMQRNCILRKAEYELLLHDAKVNLAEILNVVNSNREVDCYFTKGSEPTKIENEFWSRGKYSALKNKLLELEKELNEQKPSKNRVIEIRRELDELRLQEAQITSDSVKSATESEDRLKYLQEIVPKLMEKGWTVKGENGKQCANYVELDWRESFFAYLTDRFDDTLLITVGEDIYGKPNITIRLNDEDPQMTNERFEAIQQEIQCVLGIEEEGTCTSPDHLQIPQMRQLTQQGAAQQMREGKL